jgi:Leucine-rich repeat (LRR) protein
MEQEVRDLFQNARGELDISYMGLTEIPAGLVIPRNVTMIHFSDNQLTRLPELPAGLTLLDCNNNRLTELPELPDSLFYLFCANNQLTELPELPDGISYINCSHNQLTTLPELPDSVDYINANNNPFNADFSSIIQSSRNNTVELKNKIKEYYANLRQQGRETIATEEVVSQKGLPSVVSDLITQNLTSKSLAELQQEHSTRKGRGRKRKARKTRRSKKVSK